MSLKSFHIFFIVVATLTTLGFGISSLIDYLKYGHTSELTLGVVSLVACGLLIWYGIRFFRKLKKL